MAKSRHSLLLDPEDRKILDILVVAGYGDMTEVFRSGLRHVFAQYLAQENNLIVSACRANEVNPKGITFDGIGTLSPDRIRKKFT